MIREANNVVAGRVVVITGASTGLGAPRQGSGVASAPLRSRPTQSGTRHETQRFRRPAPVGDALVPQICARFASSTRDWLEKWTPAHPSKEACANQLPA